MFTIPDELIVSFKQTLETHPVYSAVQNEQDLRCFMEHHVFSVWDFMSLVKYLQSALAPSDTPWYPRGNVTLQRFINELVLEEETDRGLIPGTFASHFQLYCQAMREIDADVRVVETFVETVKRRGVVTALHTAAIPEPARDFTGMTFSFLDTDEPHRVAAALALGREHVIPCMFRSILKEIGVSEVDAPGFHYYLKRHIHLDEDHHAPLSLRLLNQLCGRDAQKVREAIESAELAVQARVTFWDGVLSAIEHNRLNQHAIPVVKDDIQGEGLFRY